MSPEMLANAPQYSIQHAITQQALQPAEQVGWESDRIADPGLPAFQCVHHTF
jgi:hypothetical protein